MCPSSHALQLTEAVQPAPANGSRQSLCAPLPPPPPPHTHTGVLCTHSPTHSPCLCHLSESHRSQIFRPCCRFLTIGPCFRACHKDRRSCLLPSHQEGRRPSPQEGQEGAVNFESSLPNHTLQSSIPSVMSQQVYHVCVEMVMCLETLLFSSTQKCTLPHHCFLRSLDLAMVYLFALCTDSHPGTRAAATPEVDHRRPPGRLTVGAVTSAASCTMQHELCCCLHA